MIIMSIVSIKNFTYQYKKGEPLFQNFNLELEEGKFITLVGPNGSGKSTLMKAILGIIPFKGKITIDKLLLSKQNIKEIRKKIGVVFENPDNQFVAETVMDDIAFSLENLKYSKKAIREKIEEVSTFLNIKSLLEKEPHNLSGGEKQLVSLASAIVIEPKIIILDEALTMIDELEKRKILEVLQKIKKEKKITILNITHDIEESLYGDEIIILDHGQLIRQGATKTVLKEEKLFKKIGIELPFLVELSIKLMYYGLLDEMILDMDEMVDKIWK